MRTRAILLVFSCLILAVNLEETPLSPRIDWYRWLIERNETNRALNESSLPQLHNFGIKVRFHKIGSPHARIEAETKDVCYSEECMESANRILASMDLSVDPCSDFFQFACGGYMKNNPVTSKFPEHQKFQMHSTLDNVYKKLHVILEDDSDSKHPFLQRARRNYATCVQKAEPRKCLRSVLANKRFEWFLGVAYARDYPQTDKINKTKIMFEAVKTEVKTLVANSMWMDWDSIENSVEKVDDVIAVIGYDPVVLTDHKKPRVNGLKAFMKPLRNNPFYVSHYNAICLPVASLNPPLLNLGLDALEYGAIGTIIGHEFAHCIHYYELGRRGLWNTIWSDGTIANYDSIKDCFVRQYTEELRKFITLRRDEVGKVDGRKTVAENIADLVGLQAAYRAFKRLNVTNRILMGLITDYCPEQLFFLGMAIARCTSESVQFTEDFILDRSQVHSPWKFRVNVSLKNFKAFAKAWNCPSGSEMNPIRNRCTIY